MECINNRKEINDSLKSIREACNDGIIDDIVLIRRKFNLADDIKNVAIVPEFVTEIQKNSLKSEVEKLAKGSINLSSDDKEKFQM